MSRIGGVWKATTFGMSFTRKRFPMRIAMRNENLETVVLSTNEEFLRLIERSRTRVREEGAVSSEEMRRRFRRDAEQGDTASD
jgi:hypothetical protein